MANKEVVAMLLAGGQGSRLGILTKKVAKPAVMYGGKYRIIDFPLSNCITPSHYLELYNLTHPKAICFFFCRLT